MAAALQRVRRVRSGLQVDDQHLTRANAVFVARDPPVSVPLALPQTHAAQRRGYPAHTRTHTHAVWPAIRVVCVKHGASEAVRVRVAAGNILRGDFARQSIRVSFRQRVWHDVVDIVVHPRDGRGGGDHRGLGTRVTHCDAAFVFKVHHEKRGGVWPTAKGVRVSGCTRTSVIMVCHIFSRFFASHR
jgi:hypothetical protein